MGTATKLIVRCSEKNKENKALIESIQSALGVKDQTVEVKFVTPGETDSYQIIYRNRISALAEGAQFLLAAIWTNENKELIKIIKSKIERLKNNYLDKIDKISRSKDTDMDYYQNALFNFKEELVRNFKESGFVKKNNKMIEHYLGRAEEYALLRQPRPTLITIADGIFQIEQPQNAFSEKTKTEFLAAAKDEKANLPEWFKAMDSIERKLFRHAMKDVTSENFAEKINAISSKLRSIPGVPNFSLHTLASIGQDGSIEIQRQSLRSSHIGTRDVKNRKIQKKFAEDNLKQIFDAGFAALGLELQDDENGDSIKDLPVLPILAQTLVTPSAFWKPDKLLDKDKKLAINELTKAYQNKVVVRQDGVRYRLQIISTNHPLNIGRFSPFDAEEKVSELKDVAEKFLGKSEILKKAIDELSNVDKKGWFFTKEYKFYMAGLENFIVEKIWEAAGFSMAVKYRSCVSGKDRQGLSEIYSDALQLFFEKTGDILKYNDTPENEKCFAGIYAKLFYTRHQHFNANQNALGANGIKTPAMYLPEAIQVEIKKFADGKDLFKESDVLATNNEIDKIKVGDAKKLFAAFEEKISPDLKRVAMPIVQQEPKSSLVNKLANTIKNIDRKRIFARSNLDLFNVRTDTKGIKLIREILESDQELDQKLEELENLLTKRVAKNKIDRSQETQAFYKLALNLIQTVRTSASEELSNTNTENKSEVKLEDLDQYVRPRSQKI